MKIQFDIYVDGELSISLGFEANRLDAETIIRALCVYCAGDSVSVIIGSTTVHGEAGSRELYDAVRAAIREEA